MNEYPQLIEKSMDIETLIQAEAVYVSIWNMDCPDCALWVHDALMQLENVLKVDVFYKQGVGVIIYTPVRMTPDKLLGVIQEIGRSNCHYYGAEIIGRCPAKQALHLE
ncbi:MAG: hypothetical protein LCI00_08465 [Chloroflexi bacterium]|nr:hypothetical protein [Chloroflexota bacterium]